MYALCTNRHHKYHCSVIITASILDSHLTVINQIKKIICTALSDWHMSHIDPKFKTQNICLSVLPRKTMFGEAAEQTLTKLYENFKSSYYTCTDFIIIGH